MVIRGEIMRVLVPMEWSMQWLRVRVLMPDYLSSNLGSFVYKLYDTEESTHLLCFGSFHL